ncbi:protein SipE [Ligilactobacillus acidipiscis DSM 15836]|uniref:Protein SipE n=1 Tax=Ligilactobacillus acidipiscis DSM 15836 TaxID=1423716 RepID=A0ABR5PM05_9LACO|nr:alpha/beta hydrolase family protein [Ligilactobacillus acidipiscis]KRM27571.1 protein SipE [Ligilactobacillus acidipiscis DSM 15836]GAW64161.1 acetylesterase [Ligilactobacillus acidipiscis]GEN21284.1 esterase [Ligilactobacillus acidipiscis]
MALLHIDFKSSVLNKSSSIYAITPEPTKIDSWNDLQVLYLLHGMGDDHTKWIRRTNVEQYVKKYNLVVISAQFGKSFYSNMVYGENYWDFLTSELPYLVDRMFPISDKREDRFVAGLSMGGFGAFKWALNYPKMFSNAASFSGVLSLQDFFEIRSKKVLEGLNINNSVERFRSLANSVIGNKGKIAGTNNDLIELLKQNSKSNLPNFYQFCGDKDPILQFNKKFKECAENMPQLNYQYFESSGKHDWVFWNKCLLKYINLLPLKEVR